MAFPNVKLARRPLHFIYLGLLRLDEGQKMQSLNQAIRQTLPAMAEVAGDNPEAQLLVEQCVSPIRRNGTLPNPRL